ncbi:hypothetical protein ACFFMN_18455 [Planobispora siamensis]|uniref:Uncharacterized protein n=1 Tax=Planobispora siamensis TaxID=936338 RepID=A0A8J3WK06_9ACTN|nr:hypothetical protein [Planobispora siamensis]GIH92238.1 hypothetical protein Psi01_28680 [Planobispora siamensis]
MGSPVMRLNTSSSRAEGDPQLGADAGDGELLSLGHEGTVPVLHLFNEVRALGYVGSFNLLYRYITTSPKGEPKLTGCLSHLVARPGSCPPGPAISPMSTGACLAT